MTGDATVQGDRVLVVGAGKAAVDMASTLVTVLWRCTDEAGVSSACPTVYGHVVTKTGHDTTGGRVPDSDVTVGEAGHPTPDDASVRHARRVLELVKAAAPDELVFVLLSGGG